MKWLIFPVLLTVLLASNSACADALRGEAASEAEPSAAALIEEAELSMALARDGEYGRIKTRDMERLASAHARVVELLTPVESLDQLTADQRQSLAQAQSEVVRILQPGDQDRRICKRVQATGTRLGAMECLTLAQRRERAQASRRMVEDTQRGFCLTGEGQDCGG